MGYLSESSFRNIRQICHPAKKAMIPMKKYIRMPPPYPNWEIAQGALVGPRISVVIRYTLIGKVQLV